jgi:hypothetical protein
MKDKKELDEGIDCIPKHFKKIKSKSANEFRSLLLIYVLVHAIAIPLSLFFINFAVVVKQILLLYLAYYSYMTLSSFTIGLYFVVLVGGVLFGIFDIFDVKGGLGFLIYAFLLVVEGFGVKMLSEKYHRFYKS